MSITNIITATVITMIGTAISDASSARSGASPPTVSSAYKPKEP
ncbi:hypothetical protein HDA44_003677 [Kribbella solani]|uniref:Uncharacterized protein n=1 Tax=Kribbella solani TaxID=236067 RepID=A0A841DU95_9ACTN|nr:hypothetical protein [Kribbella solani]MBB5980336.1 hypothetical protein [Kribbella solani]